MKLRQHVTSLTLEDMNILLQVALRAAPNHGARLSWYLRTVVPADRRDAELMLALREARERCNEQALLHCILAGRHTALAQYDDCDTSLVELGLAMRIPKL